jgi:hypothetical protein
VLAYSIYLPSPAYYYDPTRAKDLKKSLPAFRPWQDSNRERARRLTPTRAMAPLKCEVWPDRRSVTSSDRWPHHFEGSKKKSRHSFSLWPPGTTENFLQNHAIRSHRSRAEVLHLV